MLPKEILLSWVSELWIYILNRTGTYIFLPPFYFIFTCVDPDPYSEYGSGFGPKKLLNTDPIWIRIHNTGPGEENVLLLNTRKNSSATLAKTWLKSSFSALC